MSETIVSETAHSHNQSASMQMKFKVVFLGDQSVGKSSIILRFTEDTFDVKY